MPSSPKPLLPKPQTPLHRRTLLKLAGTGLLAGAGLVQAAHPPARELTLLNLHTGEQLHTIYWAQGRYLDSGLRRIDHLLRDHRAEAQIAMDPRLLELLYLLHQRLAPATPIHVISGYRAPQTNALLRASGGGVARKSLHMEGKAVDLRLPGVALSELHRAARGLRAGGVGYYPGSDFVHLDVGPLRHWRG